MENTWKHSKQLRIVWKTGQSGKLKHGKIEHFGTMETMEHRKLGKWKIMENGKMEHSGKMEKIGKS